jgi:AraC-like DNA-binding protein/ligand-binding sensor protein
MKSPASANKQVFRMLSASEMYRDYERAFTEATGLPLSLHEPELLHLVSHARKSENPFCAMMATIQEGCAACYNLQRKLEDQAKVGAKTLKCFAGLCETAVPVRLGENVIAFLQTGQVLLHAPDKADFNRVASTLLQWGADVDLKKLEEVYFGSRVLAPAQYQALVRLLEIFAKHLASCCDALLLHSPQHLPPAIEAAKEFIEGHSQEELSLPMVARVVNMSATYFSEKFKEATSINFVEFVARTRVEKARHLLIKPDLRISEIAFEVGFQSLSQFNRAFRQIMGESPREHRAKMVVR